MIRPLVKWAGGKRQLLHELSDRLPGAWNGYYEPFVGGAALLIHLFNQNRVKSAVISDSNPELINLYRVVQKSPEDLAGYLSSEPFLNTRESYDEYRALFNRIRGISGLETERAGIFLYLNRHGFNGLWRVNMKGEYNVPFGKYLRTSLPDLGVLQEFSAMLGKVTVHLQDFASPLQSAGPGDLVYCDPPYFPVSKTASFTQYGPCGFSPAEQFRLADECRKASERGAFVMVSNSDTLEIRTLYHRFFRHAITSRRSINSRGDRRTGAQELIITNYPDTGLYQACSM